MPTAPTDYERSRKPDENFLITELFARRAAFPIARLAVRWGFSANVVSVAGGALWLLSVPAILSAARGFQEDVGFGAWAMLLLTAALWNAGYILDVADGSVARMTGRSSAAGFFLDFVFHLIYQPMFLCSVGALLYMVTDRLLYLGLGIFSICCNWGPSFSAKEHVLCEHIAKGRSRPGDWNPDLRYRIYIDSPATKAAVGDKREPRAKALHLVREFFCFPGQFMLMGGVVVLDWVLSPLTDRPLPLTQFAFVAISLVMLARVPARVRREFKTMTHYDSLLKKEHDGRDSFFDTTA